MTISLSLSLPLSLSLTLSLTHREALADGGAQAVGVGDQGREGVEVPRLLAGQPHLEREKESEIER